MKIFRHDFKGIVRLLILFMLLVFLTTVLSGCFAVSQVEPPSEEGRDGETTAGKNESTTKEETTAEIPDVRMPDETMKAQIRSDYYDYFCELDTGFEEYDRETFVAAEYYYGIYNGCVVARLYGTMGFTQAIWKEDIEGFTFHHRDGNWLIVWKDGEITDLQGAYNAGWMTKEDLKTASFLNNNGIYG